jgi:hypothetical protein
MRLNSTSKIVELSNINSMKMNLIYYDIIFSHDITWGIKSEYGIICLNSKIEHHIGFNIDSIDLWIELLYRALECAISIKLKNLYFPIPYFVAFDLIRFIELMKTRVLDVVKLSNNEDFVFYYSIPQNYQSNFQKQRIQRSIVKENSQQDFLSFSNTIPVLKQKIIETLKNTGNYEERNKIIGKYTLSRLNDPYFIPEKSTLVNLIIECSLSIDEANSLLNIAGYHLSPYNEYDQIIRDAILTKKEPDEVNRELIKRTVAISPKEPAYKKYVFHNMLLGLGKEKYCMIYDELKKELKENELIMYQKRWGC